jgi:aminomethyltransferase
LICDLVNEAKNIKEEVTAFRAKFTDMRYCFSGEEFAPVMERLYQLI